MGGAQPLAATMAGASMLAIECQPSRSSCGCARGYLDRQASTLDEALRSWRAAREQAPVSVGLLGNAADLMPELVRRGSGPDIVTDQTSAHDLINGYLPTGWTLEQWEAARRARRDPRRSEATAKTSMRGARRRRCWISTRMAFRRSTMATTSARWPKDMGLTNAFDFPGFVPAYIRPLFCEGVVRSAGRRYRAIPRTSSAPMPR